MEINQITLHNLITSGSLFGSQTPHQFTPKYWQSIHVFKKLDTDPNSLRSKFWKSSGKASSTSVQSSSFKSENLLEATNWQKQLSSLLMVRSQLLAASKALPQIPGATPHSLALSMLTEIPARNGSSFSVGYGQLLDFLVLVLSLPLPFLFDVTDTSIITWWKISTLWIRPRKFTLGFTKNKFYF